jgi:hypothetical protein
MPAQLSNSHRRLTGSIFAAIAGALLVEFTTGSVSPVPHLTLRAIGLAEFASFVVTVYWIRRMLPPEPAAHRAVPPAYWLLVAAQMAVFGLGLLLGREVLHIHHGVIAWVCVVVGLHFVGFAGLCASSLLRWLGAAVVACGAVGLVLAARNAVPATVATTGVVAGFVLLTGGWLMALLLRRTPAAVAQESPRSLSV